MNSRTKARKIRSLLRRDGKECWICGEPMAVWAPRESDDAPTLDHVLPRSMGGTNALTNLRLAHRRCNLQAGVEHERWLLNRGSL